ncbi:MAG: hypothetical protein HRU25_02625 [Psychrobium sp.]|nr:hypothetical protein [Psychrobium sp.]
MVICAEKLELHYFFNDTSHSMNALVRNSCEAELLALAFETAKELGFVIQIDSEAYREGGLRDRWKVFGKNAGQISIFISIVALIASRIPITDNELEELQKQDLRFSIEERKLRIKKLQLEVSAGNVSENTKIKVVEILESNLKVITRKSNFYKHLSHYQKIHIISFTALDGKGFPVSDERTVQRADFGKFILHSHNLTPIKIDDAIIEIVAPVLKEGRYKWKGIYKNEAISFSMADHEFKEDVLNGTISFQHGAWIECVLLEHRKLDETGEIQKTGYSVATVIRKTDDSQIIETLQGKNYHFLRDQLEAQGKLFSEHI